MKKDKYNVAVLGASGLVGREMIEILQERNFPVNELFLIASEKSAGEIIQFKGKDYEVEIASEDYFKLKKIDIVLSSPGAAASSKYSPIAAKEGAVVIDNTSFFRMDKDVPLIVPEVNPEDIQYFSKKNIIANPNCSTIQMLVPLKPIHDKYKIKRIVVSTFQSTSGAGKKAIDELFYETLDIINSKGNTVPDKFPVQIAFNCIPQIDVFSEDGYTKEEIKMAKETHKILHNENIGVCATAVRVPVMFCHGESINIETEKDFDIKDIKILLSNTKGVKVIDNIFSDDADERYPYQTMVSGSDDVYVGRIRKDLSIKNGINLWVVADNVRKGAALNAVQIAEILI
ncbi:MAG: aspartate-semialdehyde dehydrogenase, partial [Deltaproteobacteria bacterium]|nr:aspartate-semialdehyde dehydrogenase [Deltaproteobacteria bacterium]